MKIRNGFVSNSSSSSFVVGIARVTDEQKLRDFLVNNHITNGKILKVSDIKDLYPVKYRNDTVRVISFQNEVSLYNASENDVIFYVNIINDEGDEMFSVYDDDGNFLDIDYDHGYDDFSDHDQSIIDIFSAENIGIDIKTSQVTYGAGRNG